MSSFKITGVKELEKALMKKVDEASKVKAIVRSNGIEMTNKSQRLSPFDTGQLRRSITLKVSSSGYDATTGVSASYAPYLEYGTRFSAAQPFLKPSYNIQKKVFLKELSVLLKKRT